MGGKGGIVAAAVLRVKHQRHIKHLCLQLGELSVGPQHVKQVFCGGILRLGILDDEIFI